MISSRIVVIVGFDIGHAGIRSGSAERFGAVGDGIAAVDLDLGGRVVGGGRRRRRSTAQCVAGGVAQTTF